jgi:hypothetical protein
VADREVFIIRRAPGTPTAVVILAVLAVLVLAVYALIPILLSSLVIGLALWLVLPRIAGRNIEMDFLRATLGGFLVFVGYLIPTAILRIIHPVGGAFPFGHNFGFIPLSARMQMISRQFTLTSPMEFVALLGATLRNIIYPRWWWLVLPEFAGVAGAGLALKLQMGEVFKGRAGYLLACLVAGVLLLAVTWLPMLVAAHAVPAVVGEHFRFFNRF